MTRLVLSALLLARVFFIAPFAAETNAVPGFAGLYVGMSKTALMDTITHSPVFKETEVSLDSSAVMISARGKALIPAGKPPPFSIKCMFNKKKNLQALSIVFPAKTVDEVVSVFQAAKAILGEPGTLSSKQIGFKLEAEWHFGKFAATFFASDADFEAYLLIAFDSFVREEELRGENHPQ